LRRSSVPITPILATAGSDLPLESVKYRFQITPEFQGYRNRVLQIQGRALGVPKTYLLQRLPISRRAG
jgi:hypothetical protein